MISEDTARNVVGIMGNVISFGLFLSPVPTFALIWKKKAVEQFSPMPYLATLMNCMLWVLYGLPMVHPHSVLVLTINGAGMVLEAIYLSVFFAFAPRRLREKIMGIVAAEVLFVAAVAVGVVCGAHTHEKRTLIVGILCVIFCVCMYAAPLSVMKMVIQTKSVKYMPFSLSFVSFLNGVCWTAYALIRFDIFITIPNGLGTLLGAMQLILYSVYYRTTPKEEAKSEINLPEIVSTTNGHGSLASVTIEK